MASRTLFQKRVAVALIVMIGLDNTLNATRVASTASRGYQRRKRVFASLLSPNNFEFASSFFPDPDKQSSGAFQGVNMDESNGWESRGLEDRGLEDRGLEGRGLEGRGLEGRGLESCGLEGRGLEGRGLEGRGLEGQDDEEGSLLDGRSFTRELSRAEPMSASAQNVSGKINACAEKDETKNGTCAENGQRNTTTPAVIGRKATFMSSGIGNEQTYTSSKLGYKKTYLASGEKDNEMIYTSENEKSYTSTENGIDKTYAFAENNNQKAQTFRGNDNENIFTPKENGYKKNYTSMEKNHEKPGMSAKSETEKNTHISEKDVKNVTAMSAENGKNISISPEKTYTSSKSGNQRTSTPVTIIEKSNAPSSENDKTNTVVTSLNPEPASIVSTQKDELTFLGNQKNSPISFNILRHNTISSGTNKYGVPVASPLATTAQFNSICVPLPITQEDFLGHDYAFSLLIIFNFVLFLFIAVGQAVIYWSVNKNFIPSQAHSTKSANDLTLARRLIPVAVSDFLCWFPVGLLGILASSGLSISSEINVAIAVFIMPVNSAINPFLYTLNKLPEKRKAEKEERLKKILLKKLEKQGSCCKFTQTSGPEELHEWKQVA